MIILVILVFFLVISVIVGYCGMFEVIPVFLLFRLFRVISCCHSQFRIFVRGKNANIWGYACFLGSKFFLPADMQGTFPSFE